MNTILFTILFVAMTRAGGENQIDTFKRVSVGTNEASNFFGASWADYDNDGWADLFVVSAFGQKNHLYKNQRDGTFIKITTGAIANDLADATVPAWADYDNDGDLDLYVTNFEDPINDFFYVNNGDGSFSRLASGPWTLDRARGNAAAWADFDRDGHVDLAVANAVTDREFLYRNAGNKTFIITQGPVSDSQGNSAFPVWLDYDNDGDLDLFVSNQGEEEDFVFRNDGAGKFTRVTQSLVTNGESISVGAVADYNNDGFLDMLGYETNARAVRLFKNLGNGSFERVLDSGLPESAGSSQTIAWGDFNNDTHIDLAWSNENAVDEELFLNNGDGTFSPYSLLSVGGNSYGCAWADYDNDGFLDLVITNGGGQTPAAPREELFLLHNDSKAQGNNYGWLRVKLVGTISNRSGIGALVRVFTGHAQQVRQVGAAYNEDTRVHFGLGARTTGLSMRVEWPSGIVQELFEFDGNKDMVVVEPVRLATPIKGEVQVIGRVTSPKFQSSMNLLDWTDITANMLELTPGYFRDTAASDTGHQFYRLSSEGL